MEYLASTVQALAMQAHRGAIQSIAFNNSGRFLATGDSCRVLRAWMDTMPILDADVQTSHPKLRPLDRIRGIAFSPDGGHLYVACGDTLRAFDLLSRQEIWRYQPPRTFGFLVCSPIAVDVSPAGNVLTATDSGMVVALRPDGRRIGKWWDNEAPRQFGFARSGTEIIGADGFSVSTWDAYSGREIRRKRTRQRTYGMALASLHQLLAIRTLHEVELIDADSFETVERWAAPDGLPLMAFSPNGAVLAMGGKEEIMLVELATKRCTILTMPGTRVVSLTFHPSGARLAAGCSDGTVRFWDIAPELQHVFEPHRLDCRA